jgi:hypothetical protein
MEVTPHTPEADSGLPASRERADAILLFGVIGFATALAVGGYLLGGRHEPTEAEVAQMMARRLQPYVSREECWQPLNAYCEDRPCINYETAAANMERSRMPGGYPAVAGTCGEFRYTYTTDFFFSQKRFFNAAGELVAAHTTTDGRTMNVECPTWTHYGPLITCDPTIVRDYSAPLLPERLPPRKGRKSNWNPLVD